MINIKKNIDYYMQLKEIDNYSNLLYDIATYLGFKGQDAYDFAKREKSNFSKMLKGERPLKTEFIIPLEKIFGVSLARLLDEDAYKLPPEKEMIPYLKGFRYYAYLDDMELYKKELDVLLTKQGNSPLKGMDEYGKTFLDYVIEYNSVNGIRYLHDTYHLKLNIYDNQFDTEPHGLFFITSNHKGIELARIILNMHDMDLFNDIYDPYHTYALMRHLPHSIYLNDEYLEIMMDDKDLFESLFKIKKDEYKLSKTAQRIQKKETIAITTINPIINGCLNYALNHLDKYKNQAKKILKFGIKHNQIYRNLDNPSYLLDEVGGLRDINNNFEFVSIIIKVDIENIEDIKDKEIIDLINNLYEFTRIQKMQLERI